MLIFSACLRTDFQLELRTVTERSINMETYTYLLNHTQYQIILLSKHDRYSQRLSAAPHKFWSFEHTGIFGMKSITVKPEMASLNGYTPWDEHCGFSKEFILKTFNLRHNNVRPANHLCFSRQKEEKKLPIQLSKAWLEDQALRIGTCLIG